MIGFNLSGQGIGVLRANQDNPESPFPELMALVRQINPITWVDEEDPPIFIVHGEGDTTVPIRQSERLANALSEAGAPYSFVRVPGMGHAAPPLAISLQAQAFLATALGTPSMSDEWWIY